MATTTGAAWESLSMIILDQNKLHHSASVPNPNSTRMPLTLPQIIGQPVDLPTLRSTNPTSPPPPKSNSSTITTWIFACSHRLFSAPAEPVREGTPDSVFGYDIYEFEKPSEPKQVEEHTLDLCPTCNNTRREAKKDHEVRMVKFRSDKALLENCVQHAWALNAEELASLDKRFQELAKDCAKVIVSEAWEHPIEKMKLTMAFDKLLQRRVEMVDILCCAADCRIALLMKSATWDVDVLETEKNRFGELQCVKRHLELAWTAWSRRTKIRLSEEETAVQNAWDEVLGIIRCWEYRSC